MKYDLLEKYNIPFAPYKIVKTEEELLKFAKRYKYPLVLKVQRADIGHKSDVGGVILDNWDKHTLLSSFRLLKSRFDSKIMVQKQITKGIELFAGIKKDKSFGYILMFGLGGLYVEVFKDITARICPITKADVLNMINELESKKIILGYRGKKVNINKLARMIVNLCKLAQNENIKEVEINPIKACDKNVVAVDFKVIK